MDDLKKQLEEANRRATKHKRKRREAESQADFYKAEAMARKSETEKSSAIADEWANTADKYLSNWLSAEKRADAWLKQWHDARAKHSQVIKQLTELRKLRRTMDWVQAHKYVLPDSESYDD